MSQERWVRSGGIFSDSWRKKLPYSECRNCGKYSYTTHKKAYSRKTSPDAGQVVKHKMAVVYFDSCDNCEIAENKRLKVFMDEIENLSSYRIDRYDRGTILDGFSKVEFVPKEENQLEDSKMKDGDTK